MGKPKNLTGMRFGKLTVIALSEQRHKNNLLWICKCECGKEITCIAHNLLKGNTTSCGCKRKETLRKRWHGLHGTRLYRIWQDMKNRCRNERANGYKNYGGRGINYCKEWEQFEPFYEWATNNGYQDNLSIDRIDVNGDYSPENCRWATNSEQSRNKRDNRVVFHDGKSFVLSDWSKITGIERRTIQYRLNHGWSAKDALSILPTKGANQFTYYAAREALKKGGS